MKDAIVILATLILGAAIGAFVVDYLKIRRELKGWHAYAASQRGRRQPPAPAQAPAPAPAAPLANDRPMAEQLTELDRAFERQHTPRQAKRRPSWFQLGIKRERADLVDVAKRRQEDLARHRQDVIDAARRDNTRPPAPPVALVEPIESEESTA